MGMLGRIFGPSLEPRPVEAADGVVRAPDAGPDDVILPKTKRSSRSGLAGSDGGGGGGGGGE